MTDIQLERISQVFRTYRLDFAKLALEPAIIEDYIGFLPGTSPDPFPQIIEEIMAKASGIISPMGGFAVFENAVVDPENKNIAIQDVIFSTEDIVTNHLYKSESLAVYACTAGPGITDMAAEFNRKGNPVHAYIVDSMGSIIVERAMDIIQENLRSIMAEKGLKITNRYSPGYCGWETREQRLLFNLLPDDFCGISLTDSLLMKPIKSVSGIIGIGKNVIYDQYTCNYCKDINCPYRGKR